MLNLHGNKLTWFGHATFRIVTPAGSVTFIDPWIKENPKCPAELKKIERLDAILVTHGHWDHFADVPELARRHKPMVVSINETAAWLEEQGVEHNMGMGKGGTQRVGELDVTMVHAVHSNGIHDEGKLVYGGEPAGFVVEMPGGTKIYHAGDTCAFSDMKLIAELHAPDIALLPIGGHYTMGPREAALAIRLLDVRHVIPMHYGTFPQLTGTPEAFREYARDIAGLEIHVMQPGDTLS
jgi:L-ascorbate metabolism protein UlaG (beta-lactamase superfamily)